MAVCPPARGLQPCNVPYFRLLVSRSRCCTYLRGRTTCSWCINISAELSRLPGSLLERHSTVYLMLWWAKMKRSNHRHTCFSPLKINGFMTWRGSKNNILPMFLGDYSPEKKPFPFIKVFSSWSPERHGNKRTHTAVTPQARGTVTSVPTRHICTSEVANGI